MKTNAVRVSEHAIDKYIVLMREKHGLTIKSRQQSLLSITEMYEQSEREESHGGLVKRIIDNGFEDCEYYRYKDFRIVINNNTIVTIEEAYLKRRNGLDAQTNYRCKRYNKYQNKLRKKRESHERKRARFGKRDSQQL